MVSTLFFVLSLTLLVAAMFVHEHGKRQAHMKQVQRRLDELVFDGQRAPGTAAEEERDWLAPLSRWLERVGLNFISPLSAIVLAALALACGWWLWTHWGAIVAGMFWGILLMTVVIIPQIRYKQRVGAMVEQLPLLIDQMIRGMATGRNVEGALKLAIESTPDPLREVIDKVHRQVDLGADLGGALTEAANFHDVEELHLLALAINTSRVYGGSPRDMLESIVNVIRQREQMRRELKSMTGEVRVSAWILGFLPTLMAGYMVWQNPNYLMGMWQHESGQLFLIGAVVWQLCGGLLMWRMIKSI